MRLPSGNLDFLLPLLRFSLLFSYSWFSGLPSLSACLGPLAVLTPHTSNTGFPPHQQKPGEKVPLPSHALPCPSRSFYFPLPLFPGFRGLAGFQRRSHSLLTEKIWRSSVAPLSVQQLETSDLFGELLLCSLKGGNVQSQTRPCVVSGCRGGDRVKHRHGGSEEKSTTAFPASPFLSVFTVLISVLVSPAHPKSSANRNGNEGRRRSEKEQRSLSTVFPFSVFSRSSSSLGVPENEEPSAASREPKSTLERWAHLYHGLCHGVSTAVRPRGLFPSERPTMHQDEPAGGTSRHRGMFPRLSPSGVVKKRLHKSESSCFAASHCRRDERPLMKKHLRGCQPCLSQGLRTGGGECLPFRGRSVRKQPGRWRAKPCCFVGLDLVKVRIVRVVASDGVSPEAVNCCILTTYSALIVELLYCIHTVLRTQT